MAPSAVTPLNVSADSRLSDDVLLVEPLSVNPNILAGAALAVDGNRSPHLFAILSSQGASELQSSKTSASGYTVVPLPEGAGATEIVSLVDSDDTLHAFYATESGVMHTSQKPDMSWNTPETLAVASGLHVAQVPLSGDYVAYGVGSDNNLVLYTGSNGKWSAATVDMQAALLGAKSIGLQYTAPGSWVLFAADGQSLKVWQGSENSVASGPETVTLPDKSVADVLFTYYHSNSAMVVFTDTDKNLYSSVGFSDQPQAIPSAQVAQGAGVIDDDGLMHLYGADGDGTFRVLHQTGWDENDAPIWAPIFPLDKDVTYVATPAIAGGQGFLLVKRADGTLDFLTQQGGTGPWTRLPVQGPAATIPVKTIRYRTRLTVTDVNANPRPYAEVRVTPSSLVALEVAGKTVIASPDQPAALTTDFTGAIDFSQPATGLSAVTFTVTGQGIAAPVPVTPYDYLHAQLAGKDSVFTGETTIAPLTTESLKAATVEGQPLAPKVQNDDSLADAAVSGIHETLAAAGGGTPSHAGFEIDLRDPAAPRFRKFESAADLETRLTELHTDVGAGLGSIWDDIGNYADDVWHAIKTGAMAATHWIVDAARKVVTVAVELGNGIKAVLKDLALDLDKDLHALVSMIHGILNFIGAELEKVLQWLRDLLGWTSIWNTMEALNDHLTKGLKNASTLLDGKATITSGHFFQDLKSEIDTHFEEAINSLGDTLVVPKNNQSLGSAPSQGSESQKNWLLSKLSAHLPGSNFLSHFDSGLPNDLLPNFDKAISDANLDKDDNVQTFSNFLADYYENPQDLLTARAADLLGAFQSLLDVVLGAVDQIVEAALEIISHVLQLVEKIFDYELDIPVLTWIWDNVLRPSDKTDPMTLGRLVCLVIAVPVTLIYKIGHHGKGPFDSETSEVPALPKSLALAENEAAKVFILIVTSIQAIFDMGNDAMAGFGRSLGEFQQFWAVADAAINIVVQGISWPSDASGHLAFLKWSQDDMTPGQFWRNYAYVSYWLPVGLDLFMSALPPSEATSEFNLWGDVVTGSLGVGFGVVGAAISLNEAGPAKTEPKDIALIALWPLPWATKFLLTKTAVTASGERSVGLQMLLDFASDVDWMDIVTS